MITDAEGWRAAIVAVRPDLAGQPMTLHTRGWDSNAVEVAGSIFKFPKRPEAIERLRAEARVLALVGPRVPLAVPAMRLHEGATVFSEHETIPGRIIETRDFDALEEQQKQAMAERLAAFYAALHVIPVAEAVALGIGAKPEWEAGETALPRLAALLPAPMFAFAQRAYAAYESLPAEETVLGYFDGHGWNMAFDHERGVLNGLYDFADAGLGPPSRDLTYSSLTSGELTSRLGPVYGRLTGRSIDPRIVAVRTAVQYLAELAEAEGDLAPYLAGATRWHDYMQARPELRV